MLPILIGVGAVALAGMFLEGCGGSTNEADASSSGGRDAYVPPQKIGVQKIAKNWCPTRRQHIGE